MAKRTARLRAYASICPSRRAIVALAAEAVHGSGGWVESTTILGTEQVTIWFITPTSDLDRLKTALNSQGFLISEWVFEGDDTCEDTRCSIVITAGA